MRPRVGAVKSGNVKPERFTISNTTKQVRNWQKTAFKKGQCANPGGRPKTKLFREAAVEWLDADKKRRVKIIEDLAKHKPDFLVQLVDGKLVETHINADATGNMDALIDRLTQLKRQRQAQTGDGQQHDDGH